MPSPLTDLVDREKVDARTGEAKQRPQAQLTPAKVGMGARPSRIFRLHFSGVLPSCYSSAFYSSIAFFLLRKKFFRLRRFEFPNVTGELRLRPRECLGRLNQPVGSHAFPGDYLCSINFVCKYVVQVETTWKRNLADPSRNLGGRPKNLWAVPQLLLFLDSHPPLFSAGICT